MFERERQDRPENFDIQRGRGPIHCFLDERHPGLQGFLFRGRVSFRRAGVGDE